MVHVSPSHSWSHIKIKTIQKRGSKSMYCYCDRPWADNYIYTSAGVTVTNDTDQKEVEVVWVYIDSATNDVVDFYKKLKQGESYTYVFPSGAIRRRIISKRIIRGMFKMDKFLCDISVPFDGDYGITSIWRGRCAVI
jgi:hypothetical protein